MCVVCSQHPMATWCCMTCPIWMGVSASSCGWSNGYSGGPGDWCKHNSTLLDQPSPWSPAKEVLSPTEVHDIQLKSNSSALLLPKETTPLGWHTPTQMVKMLTHHLRELENKFHNEFHSDKALLSQKFLCPTSPQCDSGCRGYTWSNLT